MIDNTQQQDGFSDIAVIQAAVDAKREEARKSMSPAESARMDAIEKAVSILEKEKVPFLLWSSPYDADKFEHPFDRDWYQFNRMSYLEPRYEIADQKNAQMIAYSLLPKLLKHQSLLLGKDRVIVVCSADGKALSGWQDGQSLEYKIAKGS